MLGLADGLALGLRDGLEVGDTLGGVDGEVLERRQISGERRRERLQRHALIKPQR